MPVEAPTFQVRPESARKVWVKNRHTEPYNEEFRGKMVSVPPNNEKKLLMGVLEANRFLSQGKQPAEQLPNGTYRPGKGPKALYIEELNDEERMDIEGVTPDGRAVEQKKAEDTAALTCQKCGFVATDQRGLGTHITTIHVKKGDDDALSIRRNSTEATPS